MTIPIYKGHDKFQQVGTVIISFNRITHVDITFSYPKPMGDAERYALYVMQGKERPTVTRSMQEDTQYSFALKKLSKADFAYRNAKLTHELISNDLLKYFDTKFFIRLSFIQRQVVAFNLKKFFWQTEDFKTHIYKYIATNAITAIISILGTLSVVKTCNKTNTTSTQLSPSLSSDTLIPQTTHKTTKSLNADSSYIDTAQQKDTAHQSQ